MYESIKNFPKQFGWKPIIESQKSNVKSQKFVVCGMGGSALAGDLLRITNNELPITIWKDYALPSEALAKEGAADTLVIACSYSGNTEETLSSFLEARKRGLPVAVITTGGKLLELAIQHQIFYIQLPSINIQPRMATGYMIKALAAITAPTLRPPAGRAGRGSKEDIIQHLTKLAESLDVEAARKEGESLSQYLRGKLPIIYSSNKNFPVAYNWKIKFNETAKIPAFANAFPELNHNEMTGFSAEGLARASTFGGDNPILSFIFLEDPDDNPRIIKRMQVTKKLYEDRGLDVISLRLEGQNKFHRIFQNLLIADWTAYHLAKYYGHDPEEVPMVEEFKKLIK